MSARSAFLRIHRSDGRKNRRYQCAKAQPGYDVSSRHASKCSLYRANLAFTSLYNSHLAANDIQIGREITPLHAGGCHPASESMPCHPELREKKGIFIRELFDSLAQGRANSMSGTSTGPEQDRIA